VYLRNLRLIPRQPPWRTRPRASGANIPPFHPAPRRDLENHPLIALRRLRTIGRDEHPHHVLVRPVNLHPGGPQGAHETIERALDPHLEDAATRSLQLTDRPLRHDGAFVHDDDAIARVLDVGEKV
jgi:hypothetical protein